MVIRGLAFDQAAANAYCIIPSLHCPTPVIILGTSSDQTVKCCPDGDRERIDLDKLCKGRNPTKKENRLSVALVKTTSEDQSIRKCCDCI